MLKVASVQTDKEPDWHYWVAKSTQNGPWRRRRRLELEPTCWDWRRRNNSREGNWT